jgi:hypothetical protein
MEIMEMMGQNRAKIWEFFDNLALKNRFFCEKIEFFSAKSHYILCIFRSFKMIQKKFLVI